MKIICIDNYNRDHISDSVVAENVKEDDAKLIERLLNNYFPIDHEDYYKAVKDDYRLYKGDV